MNKNYVKPVAEVVNFETEHVVLASGTGGGFVQPGFSGWAPDSDDSEFG